MAFCTNCGTPLNGGTKYCSNCGAPTNGEPIQQKREQEYVGKIKKCPHCGEVLDSFVLHCPSCGFELRGIKNSDSVQEFAEKVAKSDNDAQLINIIRTFPIPNTKEDVFEFMILAATNFNTEQNRLTGKRRENVSNAWLTKIEQSYQKAKLLFGKGEDFYKIQSVYDQVCKQIREKKLNDKKDEGISLALRTIGLWGGAAIFLVAFFIDAFYYANTSLLHLGAGISMIVGAFMVGKRKGKLMDVGIGVASCIVVLLLGMILQEVFFRNCSMMEVCGTIALIIVIGRLVTSAFKK